MARWILVCAVAGCQLSVEGGDGTGGSGTGPSGTDPTGTNGPTATPTGDDDDDASGGGTCDGHYTGTYDGADAGSFEADIVEDEARVYISSVDVNGVLDGVLDLTADDAVYGENHGYWMDGNLERSSCKLTGTWGLVQAPNIAAGDWRTTP